jgi:hypothetical protein
MRVYDAIGIEVDVATLTLAGLDHNDYPDYVDAYFDSGNSTEGYSLNDADLDYITMNYQTLLMEMAYEYFQDQGQ